MPGVLRRGGEDVAGSVDGGIGLPPFDDRHPDGKGGAVGPEGEVKAQKSIVCEVSPIGEAAREEVAGEFERPRRVDPAVGHLGDGEGVGPEPAGGDLRLRAEVGGDDGSRCK